MTFLQTEASLEKDTTTAKKGENIHQETHRKASVPEIILSERTITWRW